GEVTGAGRITWQPRATWNLTANGKNISAEQLLARTPGALAFTARSSGQMARGGPVGRIALDTLRGVVRGRPLAASGDLSFAPGRYDVANAKAAWGDARLAANGRMGHTWDLTWSLDVPNLAAIADGGAGRMNARGRLV